MQNLPYDAVIFDMDGLLLDTERLACRALQMICAEMGHDLPFEQMCSLAGKDQSAVAEAFSLWMGRTLDKEDIHGRWLEIYREMTATEVPLRPRVRDAIGELERQGLPFAIATTTAKDHAREKLTKAGISEHFETIVGYYCVERRKPFPDPYLKAADLIGADPRACLAFEDSDTGVRAAKAAGMTVVQVRDVATAKEGRADHLVDDLWEGFAAAGLRAA